MNAIPPSLEPVPGIWAACRAPVLLAIVGGAIDTIGFVALLGFFTAHVTGNLVLAGTAFVKGGAGLWIKLGAIPLFIATVMATKLWIDRCDRSNRSLGRLLVAEALFLSVFMIAGLYLEPFRDPGAIGLALTGGMGLIAMAIRNTAGKTLIKHLSPSTMMTGNTTQFGIDLLDYMRSPCRQYGVRLANSGSVVSGFIIGAFLGALLYMHIGFWSVLPFILAILLLAGQVFRGRAI
jgi:uncharacterized membrane protein YoaK (UPF0700 family)